MEFQHPSFLILLVIIPTLVIWYLRSGKDNEGTIRYSKYFFSKQIIQSGKRKQNFIQIERLLKKMFLILKNLNMPRFLLEN